MPFWTTALQIIHAHLADDRAELGEQHAAAHNLIPGVDTTRNADPDPDEHLDASPLVRLMFTANVSRDFREAGAGAKWDRLARYPTRPYGWPRDKSRGQSRGVRQWAEIDTIVLHTAGVRGLGPDRWLGVPTHAAVAEDGSVVLCHHHTAYLWAAHALNRRSISMEIAGNRTIDDHQVGPARALIRYIAEDIRAHRPDQPVYLSPHRHGHASRGNDCDAQIWRTVGLWAMAELGLRLGVPMGSGREIPGAWWSD